MDLSGFAVVPLLAVIVLWLVLNATAGAMAATIAAAVLVAACAAALLAGVPERVARAARERHERQEAAREEAGIGGEPE